MKKNIILVDMDNTIADFDKAVIDSYNRKNPNKSPFGLEDRKNFYIKQDFPKEEQSLIEEMYFAEGFYYGLEPIQGSLEALVDLQEKNNVFICTSPLTKNPYCLNEKFEWTKKHLGTEWTKRMIIEKDKTLTIADYLIDDKTDVTGLVKPRWKHLLFERAYNQNVNKERINWNNYRSVLGC